MLYKCVNKYVLAKMKLEIEPEVLSFVCVCTLAPRYNILAKNLFGILS